MLTRREFSLGLCASMAAAASSAPPRIAITMDDFAWRQIPGDADLANRAMLDALEKHSNLKIALFVCGSNVDNERGRQLLGTWSEAGHLICNHTYSHRPYSSASVTAAAFSADVLRGESVIREFRGFRKMFRFPALKEGDTAAKRDWMRAFLTDHGYRNGHVTIDNSDWYYDQRLRARLANTPGSDPGPYREIYLDHLWTCAQYYDGLAQKAAGRGVAHTLLVHYNLLNSLFLNDALSMFESKGWEPISAEDAYRDPIFLSNPKTLPAGESLIWALAKASPQHASLLRYPGESLEYEKEKLDRLGL